MPEWESHVRARLSSLRLSPTREQEIVDEISQHLDDRWRELIAGGMSEDAATRTALTQLRDDNVLARSMATLRQARATLSVTPGAPAPRLLSDLAHNLRYSVRRLRKQPAFAVSAVLMLAVGLGLNAAIFSVIHAVLIRPLPFPDSDELVAVYSRYAPSTGYDFPYFAISGPEFADIRAHVNAFNRFAAYRFRDRNLALDNGEVERVRAMEVTSDFFNALGVRPIDGRDFVEADAQERRGCLAVLRQGPADTPRTVVGSIIRLDDVPCEVVGVLPPDFSFRDDRVKVWTPLPIDAAPDTRQDHGLFAVARIRRGVSPEQAEAQLETLRQYWSNTYPDHYSAGHFAVSRPLHDDLFGSQRHGLVILGGAVLFVLLIVWVNLAALLVSNGVARRHEFMVRHALGANRGRLVRQLIAEAMLLALAGGVIGLVLANVLLPGLLALYPQRLPSGQAITIDYWAALYTFALVLATGCAVGAAPVLSAAGLGSQDTLRSDARAGTSSRRTSYARSVLIVCQLALSVILLVGAVVLIRGYQQLQRADLGFSPDGVLTFGVSIPATRQADAGAARRILIAIEDALAAVPGVETAGAISDLPIVSAGPADSFVVDGTLETSPGSPGRNARYLMATPRLFKSLGISLTRGRLIADSDQPGQPFVAVINETAARLYWPNQDPIGRSLAYFLTAQTTGPPIRIVGVVADVRSQGATLPAPPAVYVPFAQAPRGAYEGRSMTFVLKTNGDPTAMVPSARAAVASVDLGLPLANVRPLPEIVAGSTGQPRFTTIVMSLFASVAFFLSALGLYGTLAYGVEQRRREIGVRVALGATSADMVWMVVRHGLKLTMLGLIFGIPFALVLTRLISRMISGVTNGDMLTYVAVAGLLTTSALLASYLPASRASRVDPQIALRND